ncbi:MAG: glycosyltransferase family 2 protein [Bacteroides sp.]|nr:glycosyltransferase family 2 protein [Bacteroides sp.]
MVKYSFLLPAYKKSFLHEAINSILQQTYRDFNLIILDDCSPEDLYSLVKSFESPKITYYRNEENMGHKSLVSCWNKLLTLTDAQYIILASDDDIYKPNFLEEADRLIVKYPNVDLVRGRVANINEHGEIFKTETSTNNELLSFNEFVEFLYLTQNIKCIPNYVFKKKSLEIIGGFLEFPLAWYSDTATALKLSYNCVACTNSLAFLFRQSGLNISSSRMNQTVAIKKCLATIQYTKWFQKNILPRYSNNKKREILKIHRKETQQMLYWHIFYCDEINFLRILLSLFRAHINIMPFIFKKLIILMINLKKQISTKLY